MNRREFLASLAVLPMAASAVWSSSATMPVQRFVSDAVFRIGDVFTIAGTYGVNPMTHQSTGYLQQFVVTATTSDGDIEDLTPQLWSDGPDPTVTAIPPYGAIVTPLGMPQWKVN